MMDFLPRSSLALALLGLAAASPAAATGTDPFALASAYADGLAFEVRRDGRTIGSHEVTFEHEGEALRVTARSDIRVRFLGIPVYRFTYRSESLWDQAGLLRLQAETDDDGQESRVVARREEEALRIEGSGGTAEAAAPLFPTDHWHSGVLRETAVLNTLTGRLNEVEIVFEGEESIEAGGETLAARRYSYQGDLQATVWYDREGRWVGLRFLGRDGTPIDYVCRRCGAS